MRVITVELNTLANLFLWLVIYTIRIFKCYELIDQDYNLSLLPISWNITTEPQYLIVENVMKYYARIILSQSYRFYTIFPKNHNMPPLWMCFFYTFYNFVCLSFFCLLYFCLYVFMSFCLYAFKGLSLLVILSCCLFVFLYICLVVLLSVCLIVFFFSFCLFVFLSSC